MGGKEQFCTKLDSLFIIRTDSTIKGIDDIHGRIGEYWHGNEPSHHIIFLYDYAGQPWKAQKLVHEVMKSQYGNKPHSLCGNDDCGQMSAWYIFNAMGFYPVCPGSNYYMIGSPTVKKAVMHLWNGKHFSTIAENLSEENIYIQSVTVNGKKREQPYLTYDEIKDGSTVVFTMGAQPNTTWGTLFTMPQ